MCGGAQLSEGKGAHTAHTHVGVNRRVAGPLWRASRGWLGVRLLHLVALTRTLQDLAATDPYAGGRVGRAASRAAGALAVLYSHDLTRAPISQGAFGTVITPATPKMSQPPPQQPGASSHTDPLRTMLAGDGAPARGVAQDTYTSGAAQTETTGYTAHGWVNPNPSSPPEPGLQAEHREAGHREAGAEHSGHVEWSEQAEAQAREGVLPAPAIGVFMCSWLSTLPAVREAAQLLVKACLAPVVVTRAEYAMAASSDWRPPHTALLRCAPLQSVLVLSVPAEFPCRVSARPVTAHQILLINTLVSPIADC